jgi:hypothetical protein
LANLKQKIHYNLSEALRSSKIIQINIWQISNKKFIKHHNHLRIRLANFKQKITTHKITTQKITLTLSFFF